MGSGEAAVSDTIMRIDETPTFYSEGLGAELEVKREDSASIVITLEAAEQIFVRYADAFRRTLEALAPVFEEVGWKWAAILARLEPLLYAYERQERLKRVYRRWNHPLLRADMHSRKCEKGRT